MSNIGYIDNSYLQNITKYLDGKNYYETFVQDDEEKLDELKRRILKHIDIPINSTKEKVLDTIYAFALENYRNDIIFKIEFLEKLSTLIDSMSDTYVVNEFKTGRCVTDIAIFNGKSISFEIKSDLDKGLNLKTQIEEFSKVFDKNYLVTNNERVEQFSKLIPDSCGLISVDKNFNFTLIKDADINTNISFEYLFKILRKEEYLDLVLKYYGFIPDVPNTKIYSESFNMLSKIDLDDFKADFILKIKERDYSVCLEKLTEIEKIKRQGYLANFKI
jgi:hypothetical protein